MHLNIIQWNCNGIKRHVPELQLLTLHLLPTIFAIQETRLDQNENFELRNFNIFRNDCTTGSIAHGGVAILTRKEILVSMVHLNTPLQAVAVRLPAHDNLTICNIYMPPDNNITFRDISDLFEQLHSPCIITGDFNAHSTLWGSNQRNARGRLIEQLLDETELILLNDGRQTHLTLSTGTTTAIDLTLTSPSMAVKLQWNPLPDLFGSDHYPIHIYDSNRPPLKTYTRKWKFENANWEKYRQNFEIPELSNNIKESVNIVTENILKAADSAIPKSSGIGRPQIVPWWNKNIAKLINEKRKAMRTFNKKPTTENMILFKKLRALCRKTIRAEKQKTWEKYLSTVTPNTPISRIWQKVRAIAGKAQNILGPIKNPDGHFTAVPEEMVELFAEYFEAINSTSNYDPEFRNKKPMLEKPLDFNTFETISYNAPISIGEFNFALRKMKSKSSPGPDNISTIMIEMLPDKMQEKILELYNKIWDRGWYPDQWREATVIPILKEGKDRTETASYRPISLTCCLGKLLEKIVNNRLIWWLEKHELINADQCGFRKYHSTMDQLVNLETAIHDSFREKEHLVAVFFDLERAYDRTWRHGILRKIYEWGFRGNLPRFIGSFLEERNFRVRINDKYSSQHVLENGVPQGSTLSVTLFMCAINDITKELEPKIGRSLYVDDLVLFTSARYMSEIRPRLQRAIDTVTQFANDRGLRFSENKTCCVDFCKLRDIPFKPRLLINKKKISVVESVRFLGLILDNKLTWNKQIESLRDKCKKALNIIRCMSSIKWGSGRESLMTIYKLLIQSKLDYGSIIYAAATKTQLAKLDPILYAGIRCATGAFCTSPRTSLCCEAGILPLEIRRTQLTLNYAMNVWTQPNNINYSSLTGPIRENSQPITKRSQSFRERVEEIKQNSEIQFDPAYPKSFCRIPPWMISDTENIKELTRFKKDETNGEIFKRNFLSIKNKYPEATCLYTDGSKTGKNVGCALVVNECVYKWKLHPITSIYTAELTAIMRALDYCQENNKNEFLICCDNLSAVIGLENPFTDDPIIQEILSHMMELKHHGKKVIIVWTPGHMGIKGNEEADKAAKEAANMENYGSLHPITYSDMKAEMRKVCWNVWQSKWNETNAKLKRVKVNVDKWTMPEKLNRRETVIITRLRIGHTRLTTDYLITGSTQPECQTCGVTLDVEHILLHCSKWIIERKKRKIGTTLLDALEPNYKRLSAIIGYCKEINIYDKL